MTYRINMKVPSPVELNITPVPMIAMTKGTTKKNTGQYIKSRKSEVGCLIYSCWTKPELRNSVHRKAHKMKRMMHTTLI